jgi:hypothetical protein
MSQTGPPGRLSFSISALRVRRTHTINVTSNITEVTALPLRGDLQRLSGAWVLTTNDIRGRGHWDIDRT